MTRRLWCALRGEHENLVAKSPTGKLNDDLASAWSSYYADRGLLLLTVGWLGLRISSWSRIDLRPESIYEPQMWLAWLAFPSLPPAAVWYALVVAALALVVLCLVRPRMLVPRVMLAIVLLLVITPEFGFGHIQHVNHLFLMAHVYSMFRPHGRPRSPNEAEPRAQGYSWFLLGLLAVYTASGLWKVVDITIRDVIKPGVTWLEPEAMIATTVSAMRTVDLPMTIPGYADAVAWIFPIGYVMLAIFFSASIFAAFRRPLLVVIIPLIAVFHLLNAILLYALFISTIIVAIVVLAPYDFFVPGIRKRLVPIRSTSFVGSGFDAQYERVYEGGDVDRFLAFYAYRESLRDRSTVLSSLLYYPGIATASLYIMRIRTRATGIDA